MGGQLDRTVRCGSCQNRRSCRPRSWSGLQLHLYILECARFDDVVIAMSETNGYGRLVCACHAHESGGRPESGDFAKDIPI